MSDKNSLIDLMATHEATLSQLYSIYAQKLAFYEQLWLGLAAEETEHARWLHALNEKVDQGTASFNQHLFKLPAIKTSLAFLEKKVLEARTETMTAIQALSVSLDMEKSMLESGYFKVFSGDSLELVQIFAKLEEATQEHAHKIKDLWDAQGQVQI